MRFTEIADPEDQLALWRLISDNVWSAVAAQARELARQKAQAAATSKIKKIKPKKAFLGLIFFILEVAAAWAFCLANSLACAATADHTLSDIKRQSAS